ncbi:hypothetical protein Trydic_g2858 [Trypoxylus dichotomus]
METTAYSRFFRRARCIHIHFPGYKTGGERMANPEDIKLLGRSISSFLGAKETNGRGLSGSSPLVNKSKQREQEEWVKGRQRLTLGKITSR